MNTSPGLEGTVNLQEFKKSINIKEILSELPSDKEENWRYTKLENFPLNSSEDNEVNVEIGILDRNQNFIELDLKSLQNKIKISVSYQINSSDFLNNPGYYGNINKLHLNNLKSVVNISVSRNSNINQVLYLRPKYTSGTKDFYSAIVLNIEEGANVKFFESLYSEENLFSFPKFIIKLGKNARLAFVTLQQYSSKTKFLGSYYTSQHADSLLDFVYVCLGSQVSRLDLSCNMDGERSSAKISTIMLVDGTQHADFHAAQIHNKPNCTSDLYCKCIVKDKSRAVYFGVIEVAENAQKTDAYQTNKNLLLSKEARIDSIPNLHIKANDVKCSHGSSTGRVDEEELFYLCSRGLRKNEAEKLLVEGFLQDIIKKVSILELQNYIFDLLLNKLNN